MPRAGRKVLRTRSCGRQRPRSARQYQRCQGRRLMVQTPADVNAWYRSFVPGRNAVALAGLRPQGRLRRGKNSPADTWNRALAALAFAPWNGSGLIMEARKRKRTMNRDRLEELRARVPCETVLLQAGFMLDVRESSRRALKF